MYDRTAALTISNVRFEPGSLPFELAPDTVLRSATDHEIQSFQSLIEETGLYGTFFIPYDKEKNHEGAFVSCEPRWWTLETGNWGNHLDNLNGIGKLLNDRLHFAIRCSFRDDTHSAFSFISPPSYDELQSMTGYTHEKVSTLTAGDLQLFRNLYQKAFETDGADDATTRALKLFVECDSLPSHSPLLNLSYFSIIECLLTKKSESHPESITHQIKTKTRLIFNMHDSQPAKPDTYKDISTEKLWADLYSLRSKIAHGGEVDFSEKTLRNLKDIDTANDYIRNSIQSLLIFAIENPKLLQDLRHC